MKNQQLNRKKWTREIKYRTHRKTTNKEGKKKNESKAKNIKVR